MTRRTFVSAVGAALLAGRLGAWPSQAFGAAGTSGPDARARTFLDLVEVVPELPRENLPGALVRFERFYDELPPDARPVVDRGFDRVAAGEGGVPLTAMAPAARRAHLARLQVSGDPIAQTQLGHVLTAVQAAFGRAGPTAPPPVLAARGG